MDTLTTRTLERFRKAILSLEKALDLRELPERAERDAVLLRFELAAELAPKLLQRILAERGADVVLPKDSIRTAATAGLITDEDGEALLAMTDDRNRMVHDYAEAFADELLLRIKETYAPALRTLADSAASLI